MTTLYNDERIIRVLSTHWIKYLWPTFIYLLLMACSMVLFLIAGAMANGYEWLKNAAFISGLLVTLIVHHWFFQRLLSEYMIDIIVTNRRVIFLRDSLLFRDDLHSTPIEQIHGVEARVHGLLENVLHYGTLCIDTGGTVSYDTEQHIKLVPHPHTVARDITAILEKS